MKSVPDAAPSPAASAPLNHSSAAGPADAGRDHSTAVVGDRAPLTGSLPESFRTVPVPNGAGFWRKMLAFTGPGFLVAVGYMDPGNWATDLAGGSQFGYALLSVILISNFMAILLQHLCARLGIAAGLDLAQACRAYYSKPVNFCLWVLCELAICACDLAEVIGSAIALQLLFGIPLPVGVCITVLDVMLILLLQHRGFRYLEAFIVSLILIITICFAFNLAFAKPSIAGVLMGFVPSTQIVTNTSMLFIAIGILGATVMPHNLYLHSSIVQTRAHRRDDDGKREAIKFATIDSTVALMFALLINAAILILAAAAFHGRHEVAEIYDAHRLLSPVLGVTVASTLFAVALLASGQNATITGTLAGQIVMEGFLQIRIPPWLRRIITRLIAIIPAAIVSILYGESGTNQLLVLSQVILSLQLPFAVVPLIVFVSRRQWMGKHRPSNGLLALAWVIAAVIIVLNAKLLFDVAMGLFAPATAS
jgi:manganese transport protein